MDVRRIHTKWGGVKGVIVEVDGLCREGNSIPRDIELNVQISLSLYVRGAFSLHHAIASFCVHPSSSSEVMEEG